MKFLLLIHIDPALLEALPQAAYDAQMRECLRHADAHEQPYTTEE